jgi:hypothetical protein
LEKKNIQSLRIDPSLIKAIATSACKRYYSDTLKDKKRKEILMLSRKLMIALFSAGILVGCSSEKNQETMETQPDELTPAETEGLTLHQKEELKISEDNVMNPFPG